MLELMLAMLQMVGNGDLKKIEEVLPHLTWVRFTCAAGTPESYSKIMFKGPEHTHVFEKAMNNIKYAVDLKEIEP